MKYATHISAPQMERDFNSQNCQFLRAGRLAGRSTESSSTCGWSKICGRQEQLSSASPGGAGPDVCWCLPLELLRQA